MATVRDDAVTRQRLDELTHTLRPLHKTLIDVVQRDYERLHGTVAGPVALFQLLTTHAFFAWLQPLSALMAQIDELYDQKEPIGDEELAAVQLTLESLIGDRGQTPPPHAFVVRYLAVLQAEPDVVMDHARVRRALDELARLLPQEPQ
jgi:hypothetical protein